MNGRYELGDMIGRGGMADVFRATDLRLGREVAVKILRADLARDPQFLARFRREAQAVARLNHPAIVSVYDSGEQTTLQGHADAVHAPYIVMEYVQGQTLKALIKSGQLSIDQTIEYVYGVLGALEYSHKAGIVHRDIKPANVMVNLETGAIKVMDFGIARAIADSASTMTQTQAVVGTAQYLSPEQAMGETVDARSDLYSAGCMLFEMLTGQPPFQGDSPVSVAYQHVRSEAPAPSQINPEVSGALDSVVAKALTKDRSERFVNAAAFRRALRSAQEGISIQQTELDSDQPTEAQPAISTEQFTTPMQTAVVPSPSVDETALGETMARPFASALTPVEPATQTNALELTHEQLRVLIPELEEREKARRKKRRGIAITMITLTLLVLGGAGFALYAYLNRPPEAPPLVAVPAVAKMNESDALAKLFSVGLSPNGTIDRKPSTSVPKGEVISTDPAEGAMLSKGSTVTLVVSTGPSTAVVPTGLTGKTEAFARDRLRDAGLVGGSTSYANSQTIPANMVITTKPAPGESVPIDSTVEIVLSSGQFALPDVTNKPVAEAEAQLKALGLIPVATEVETTEHAEGTVFKQSPLPQQLIVQGGTVNLSVAKKPKPPPTQTPTTTATATDQPTTPDPRTTDGAKDSG